MIRDDPRRSLTRSEHPLSPMHAGRWHQKTESKRTFLPIPEKALSHKGFLAARGMKNRAECGLCGAIERARRARSP
jgi:hypothetical protein